MLPDLAREEFAVCLDEVVTGFLAETDWEQPPVDALKLARTAGMAVAIDSRLLGRARTVRLQPGEEAQQASIMLRPEQRAERRQWAVAHEIGEQLAYRVFAELGVMTAEADVAARERVANLLASRLLLPSSWCERHAGDCHWDLFELKAIFTTASHELIARRMLDFESPVLVTLFDQSQVTWRRSNVTGRVPTLMPGELDCWREARETGRAVDRMQDFGNVQAWPIHEPGWQREILRTEVPEDF